ncbi:hypothetical protein BD311DRAFT_677777 [Dichomitus squalens]|uniref:Uncharacterized protein n=1 Tax=Dichomitus squalens TaxID=114155 RepID=A0A4Q9M481_9APHY|nr:hypothetical protein BD311DRAFT_677777 [Dichomitus squalens]
MPKRTLRDRNSIENLGHYAQKRFRVPSRQPARSRGTGDKENVLPLASEVRFPAQLGIAKKYRSHRVLPNDILEELDREGITPDN